MEKEFEELRLATEAKMAAEVLMRQARQAETNAINRLNAAQKAIDNAMTRLRAQAPRESEWHEQVLNPNRGIMHRTAPVVGGEG